MNFDETVGSTVDTNNFALGRLVTADARLIVTLNGEYLRPSIRFYSQQQAVITLVYWYLI